MLGQVQRTQYDLRFPLFGIQVNVHPLFWLVSVIMGWNSQFWEGPDGKPEYIAIWVVLVLVSILVHEFGHALMAKAFGYRPEVFLYTFGGLAAFNPDHRYTTSKSIAISFAGPGAGFILFGLVRLVRFYIVTQEIQVSHHVVFVIMQMEYINLWWGLVNLLPVLPLDGGRICEAILDKLMRNKSKEWTAIIGIVVGVSIALYFFMQNHRYPGFLFAYLSYMNFNNYQAAKRGYW